MNKEAEWERTVSGLEKFRKISDKNIPVKVSLPLSTNPIQTHKDSFKYSQFFFFFRNNAHSISEIYMTILW